MLDFLLSGFTNWKTSATAALTALFMFLNSAGVLEVPQTDQNTIIAFMLLVFGWLAKDGDKAGTPTHPIKQ